VKELNDEGLTTKNRAKDGSARLAGKPFDKGVVYKLLRNRIYIGDAVLIGPH